MKLRLLFLLLALSTLSFAQVPGGGGTPPTVLLPVSSQPAVDSIQPLPDNDGKISGILIDSTTQKPVESASITLLNSKTNQLVDRTTTDGQGAFAFSKLAIGSYQVAYSFAGYQGKRMELITIEKGSDINLGSLTLQNGVSAAGAGNAAGLATTTEEKAAQPIQPADSMRSVAQAPSAVSTSPTIGSATSEVRLAGQATTTEEKMSLPVQRPDSTRSVAQTPGTINTPPTIGSATSEVSPTGQPTTTEGKVAQPTQRADSTRSIAQVPGRAGAAPTINSATSDQSQDNQPTADNAEPLPRGNGKISGILIDSTTQKPVEFATIALLDSKTNKPIDGTTTDDKGTFSLNKLAAGSYRLEYSFIGYKSKRTKLMTIDKGSAINLGSVTIQSDTKTLNEVNVVGQAAMIEEKVDRLVYNADKDILAKGGDATDIMRKVPMLSVDLDGNVSLRGSSNVRVLINNKPSTIMASSVADALKQIPADQIKTVEVITSPSAKYDAEGSAGIINIITKKASLQGATLDVNGGLGNRGALLGLSGSYRTGKMGFSLSGFGRAEYNVRGTFTNDQTTTSASGKYRTLQSANTLNQRVFGSYQLGWDYDIDKRTSLTASVRYGARNGNTIQNNLLTQTFLPTAVLPFNSQRNVNTKDLSGTVDANVTYTKIYKPQQELSILGLYSRNNRTNDFVADILGGTDFQTIASRQKNLNGSYNQESTIQIDYQTPIKKNQLLEFGGKGIFRQVNSDFAYLIANGASNQFVSDTSRQGNTLNYDQEIAATYISYTLTTKNKYTLKAGARYEYTFVNASFNNESNGPDRTIPNYGNLVPSINISRSLGGGKIIKLGYNRRLQRPGIQFLNPNRNTSNPTNITEGNPYLAPELTDNLEFGTSATVKGIYLNASLFARRTNNEITAVRDITTQIVGSSATNSVPQQAIRTTYQNIGRQDAYGLNLFGNGTLFSKWQLGGGVDIYHTNLTNGGTNPIYAASNSGWIVAGRIMTSLSLKNGWGFQGFGGIRGRDIQLQGYQSARYFYSIGGKKDFNQKRGSIGLSAENFLNHPFVQTTELSSPILTQYSTNSFYNAGVRLTFSYKIGKMSFDDAPRKRRKSVNNDDVKGDDGGGNDAGGGQQPAAPAGGGGRPR